MAKSKKKHMSRMIWLLCCMTVAILTWHSTASAETKEYQVSDTITASLDESGNMVVTGTGAMPQWESYTDIPWYEDRSEMVTLEIGGGITSVSSQAFYDVSDLETVVLKEGITEIQESAFEGCYSLSSLQLPDSLTTLGKNCFKDCSKLVSIVLPDSVTTIGDYSFSYCRKLKDVQISENVSEIGESAFSYTALEKVKIPEKVTQLKGNVFSHCMELVNVTLPSNLKEIGKSCFNYCDALENITFPSSLEIIGDSAFYACDGLKEIRLPDSVTTLGSQVFSSCDNLEEIELSQGLVTIGNGCFSYCNKLTEVNIPKSLKTVGTGTGTFYGCSNLKRLLFDPNAELIPSYIGKGSSVQEIIIPDMVSKVGDFAFYDCENITDIIMGKQVKEIGQSAFYDYDYRNVRLYVRGNSPDYDWEKDHCTISQSSSYYVAGVNIVAYYFSDGELRLKGSGIMNTWNEDMVPWKEISHKIKVLAMDDEITSIGSYAFSHMEIEAVTIGSNVETIGEGAFYQCDSLKYIVIGDKVTNISEKAFDTTQEIRTVLDTKNQAVADYNWSNGNRSLVNIQEKCLLTDNITGYILDGNTAAVVGEGSMDNCNVTSVWKEQIKTIETFQMCGNITSLGSNLLAGAEKLKNVELVDSITSISYNAFKGCSALESITLPKNLQTMGDGVFYQCENLKEISFQDTKLEKIPTRTFYQCNGLTKVLIPSNIKEISSYAFQECSNLTEVEFQEGIKTIGGMAFKQCDKLETVNIPRSLNKITGSDGPFAGIAFLTKVQFADKARSIPARLFYNCASLKEITLPDTINSIEENAFYGCTGLQEVQCPANLGKISKGAFGKCTGLTKIVFNQYLTTIGDSAFNGCSGLTKMELTQNIATLGSGAFRGCTSLSEVVIGSKIHTIKYDTFRGTGLHTVVLPYGIMEIGEDAFSENENLTSITIPAGTKTIDSSAFDQEKDKLILKGAAGSQASIFAQEQGYSFQEIADENVTVSMETSTTVPKGKTKTIEAVLSDSYVVGEITWLSSDENIVSVEQSSSDPAKAVIQGKTAGNANITVQIGNKTATCSVTVESKVISIVLNESSVRIVGKNVYNGLRATCYPSDAVNQKLIWSSSDERIAKVDENGAITPLREGTVRIYVRDDASVASATCIVKISFDENNTGDSIVYTTGVKLNAVKLNLSKENPLAKLKATVLPGNATNKTVVWQSEKPNVAQVDANGVVTAKSNGTVNIIATTVDGSYEAKCTVTVKGFSTNSNTKKPKSNTVSLIKTSLGEFKILSAKDKTVSFTKLKNKKSKTLTIPAQITYKKVTYRVVAIEKNTMKNCKNLTKVSIGKNVSNIGDNAFYGCKKLKKIIFANKNAPKISKNAFGKISSKAVFAISKKCSKSQYKKYKKALGKKTGFNSKKMKLKKQ